MGTRQPVNLRSIRDADGSRYLDAHLNDAGDLVIDGQDLGPAVERAFGEGLTEYEWRHTIRAANVPLLVAALGGAPGEDVLVLLARTCTDDDAARLARLLGTDEAVPAEFWSRIGK